MPDLIRHPFLSWIPAFAGKTGLAFIVAGVIMGNFSGKKRGGFLEGNPPHAE
jgi:hypothetical protein